MIGHRAYSKNGVGTNGNVRANHRLCPNPGTVFYDDVPNNQIKGCLLVIMISAEEHSPLADAYVIANGNHHKIIYPYILTYPYIVPDS